MRPRFLITTAIALVLVPIAWGSGHQVSRLSSSSRQEASGILIQKRGWAVEPVGHTSSLYDWGAVLTNTSKTRDALRVHVKVRILTSDQGELIGGDWTLAVIPAGQSFYIGGGAGDIGVPHITRLVITAQPARTAPKRYSLPPISNVRLLRANGVVTAVMTNPYSTSMSVYDPMAYLVVFDRNGRVLGGGDLGHVGDNLISETIKPGARVPVSFSLPAGVSPARIAYVRISIDP